MQDICLDNNKLSRQNLHINISGLEVVESDRKADMNEVKLYISHKHYIYWCSVQHKLLALTGMEKAQMLNV